MTKKKAFVDHSTNNTQHTMLPAGIFLPVNHCNLPAVILGGLTYQQYPTILELDNLSSIHGRLFSQLENIDDVSQRAEKFMDYMTVYFQLEKLKQLNKMIGSDSKPYTRIRANYLNILRGWLFDTDSREGAILKGWVESRFGLLPTWHKGVIENGDDEQYQVYLHERTAGLYNTNALESQLDLLYSYCQYELAVKYRKQKYLLLYRGINSAGAENISHNNNIVLLNNLNAFSMTYERADEFGDIVLKVKVPVYKVFFYSGLLPGILQGEDESMVIGGLYQVEICKAAC